MAFSRRDFLTRAGQAGGSGATFLLMQSLGLLPLPQVRAQAPLSVAPGLGTSVTILGGGIAGLVAAHELTKSGYECVILEARDRPGGRNWSIRRGTRIPTPGGTEQTCNFADGLYLNAGPARLPSAHTTMLNYCRDLGVPLEVEVNFSRGALMQSPRLNSGKPVERRQVAHDTRGHVAELLSKCIDKGALNQELTADDRARMLNFLSMYGDLNEAKLFKGTERSGFTVSPGAGRTSPVRRESLPLRALLEADLWASLLEEDEIGKQATMFQPVGGMDRIVVAFEARLPGVVRYGAEVRQIRQSATGVSVAYRDAKTGATETLTSDYCICTIPFSVLKSIDADFPNDVKEAILGASHDAAYKVAWESRRFWEQENKIYGGISFLQQTVDTLWYPSADMFSPNGILVAGYSVEGGTAFGGLPNLQAKLAASRQAVEILHPGRGQELRNPVYVSWGQMPFSMGSWASDLGGAEYQRIIQPERRLYFAGDHTSQLSSWQEGAALSAHRAISQISQRIAR